MIHFNELRICTCMYLVIDTYVAPCASEMATVVSNMEEHSHQVQQLKLLVADQQRETDIPASLDAGAKERP